MTSNSDSNGDVNPGCPYCGAELDDHSKYGVAEGHPVKYGCNNDGCAATAWTPSGWAKEQEPATMLAHYL